jgi:23S rRNA (cytidine1920-2'-O)/16S rRNA (cytidine1409-2'-O)-methyltransferase
VLEEVLTFALELGFAVRGLVVSPLKGPAGNTEFLAWLSLPRGDMPPVDVKALAVRVVSGA